MKQVAEHSTTRHQAVAPFARQIQRLVLLCVVSFLASCTGQGGAPDQDAFDVYWQQFRAAVLSNQPEAVADLTRFPFVENGIVPGLESVEHSRASFLSSWNRLMAQESGNGPATMRDLIASRASLEPGDIAPSGRTAQVGMFEFERTENGWRFTGAFLSD